MNRLSVVSLAGVVAAVLIASVAIPRVREREALSELRAAGLSLFGDEPSAETYARGQLQVRRHPALDAKLEAIAQRVPTASGGGRMAALGYVGMARLSREDLQTWLELRRRLADSSPAVCAGLWKGGLSAPELAAGLRGLSPEDKRRWIEISVRAALLELDASRPPSPIAGVEESRAWRSLLDRLPADRRTAIDRAADKRSPLSDDDACRAFRILAADAAILPPDQRDTLIRAITCPFLVDATGRGRP